MALRDRCGPWAPHPFAFTDRDFGGNCVEAFQRHVLAGLAGHQPIETLARDYLTNLELEALVYRSAAENRKLPLEAPA